MPNVRPFALRSLLCLLVSLLPALAAQAQLEAVDGPVANGVPITFEIFNVTAGTAFDLDFAPGATVTGPLEVLAAPPAVLPGLDVGKVRWRLAVPEGAIAPGVFETVSFRLPITLTAPLAGSWTGAAPLLLRISNAFGQTLTQGGEFGVETPSLPPTCELAGCGAEAPACPARGGNLEPRCYLFQSAFFCCLQSPGS
ncbi:MAG: hypothetical protein AAF604_19050 [Acidobacteriota bacterium]